MQKALCNVSAEQGEHIHICTSQKGHIGNVHFCKCGAVFIIVKKKELERPLVKVQ